MYINVLAFKPELKESLTVKYLMHTVITLTFFISKSQFKNRKAIQSLFPCCILVHE